MDCLRKAFAEAFGFDDSRVPDNATMREMCFVCWSYDLNLYWGNSTIDITVGMPLIIIILTGEKYKIDVGQNVLDQAFEAHAQFYATALDIPEDICLIAAIDVGGNAIEERRICSIKNEAQSESKTFRRVERRRVEPKAGGYL